ncbi:uncharacterized protein [Clytia hemisphaerica]|uniref:uncharacterized protein n=1 Tax=Clytia hemisphaerica TaxID=252671 RepID=UPI0034D46F98|eukprot:TCONS_00005606-protein
MGRKSRLFKKTTSSTKTLKEFLSNAEVKQREKELSKMKDKLESNQKYSDVLKKNRQVKNLDEEVISPNKKKKKRKKKNNPNPIVNNVSQDSDANNNSSHAINLTCKSQANLQLCKKHDVSQMIITDDIGNKQLLKDQDAVKQDKNILHTQYVHKEDAECLQPISNEEWKMDDGKGAAYHACKWFNMILIVVSTVMLVFCFILHQDQFVFEKITTSEYGTEDQLNGIFLDHS